LKLEATKVHEDRVASLRAKPDEVMQEVNQMNKAMEGEVMERVRYLEGQLGMAVRERQEEEDLFEKAFGLGVQAMVLAEEP